MGAARKYPFRVSSLKASWHARAGHTKARVRVPTRSTRERIHCKERPRAAGDEAKIESSSERVLTYKYPEFLRKPGTGCTSIAARV